jgi:site-specific recombinase XerD
MPAKSLIIRSDNYDALVPKDSNKNTVSRLRHYANWLDQNGRHWFSPDMAVYRDYLLDEHGLAPSSASAHLSTIRGRYQTLLRDNAVRQMLFDMAAQQLVDAGQDDSPANRKAVVDELVERLKNTLDPHAAPVRVTHKQDIADSEHIRLTPSQGQMLMAAPGIDTLKGLRDTTIISLMLCTGIREAELCALTIDDLRQELNGHVALAVRHGKGDKQRLVPYGDHEWVLAIVDAWINEAGIMNGIVFRSFTSVISRDNPRGNLQAKAMSERAVQKMLVEYPIMVGGRLRTVHPHDLRRSYARRLFDAGIAPVAIQQNLGHASLETTLGYIGPLDADARKPPAVFTPPFRLNDLQRK